MKGIVLNKGAAEGLPVFFDEPLSFWGGFDAERGMVIDRQHPQYGTVISGKILVMPGSKGSAGTPGVLAESLHLRTGPAGIILDKADINVTTGTLIISELYDQHCPVVTLSKSAFLRLRGSQAISIDEDGQVQAT